MKFIVHYELVFHDYDYEESADSYEEYYKMLITAEKKGIKFQKEKIKGSFEVRDDDEMLDYDRKVYKVKNEDDAIKFVTHCWYHELGWGTASALNGPFFIDSFEAKSDISSSDCFDLLHKGLNNVVLNITEVIKNGTPTQDTMRPSEDYMSIWFDRVLEPYCDVDFDKLEPYERDDYDPDIDYDKEEENNDLDEDENTNGDKDDNYKKEETCVEKELQKIEKLYEKKTISSEERQKMRNKILGID